DAQTMNIHHSRHHAAYVAKLNGAIEGRADLASSSIDDLCKNVANLPDAVRGAVRNNGGGHYNHSLFWQIIAPAGDGGAPSPELAAAIDTAFGSMDAMKEQFANAGATRFGSGWAWLGVKADGGLCVSSTPNQDNPLMTGMVECECTPILGLDVWEHAYYLHYQNRRPDYIDAFWSVVNWNEVSRRFADAS
ncbi:MAG: superoxide dismutase, partial [Planctomycetota bacterium]|nr:superoxide dismutase [Planctomycetota bacterium]